MIKKIRIESVNPRIAELDAWLSQEYPKRLAMIQMAKALGLPLNENERILHIEAYNKTQELRGLQGKALLPEIKTKKII